VSAAHTPGPWHLEDNHVVAGSVRVAVVDTPSIHAGVDHWEADKNACLIVNAPELLAALVAARLELPVAAASWNEDDNPEMVRFHVPRVLNLIARVDAAIKKAAGAAT
jgi:hypothetical protein